MKPKLLAPILAALLAPLPSVADARPAADAPFDIETLKSRGINPDVAEYFKHEKKFLAGLNYVTLVVNGARVGRTQASFDQTGQLCMDRPLLARANIAVPANTNTPEGCIDLQALYPQAVIRLQPGKEQIELVVPQQALRPQAEIDPATAFTTGGAAALLNYDVTMSRSSSHGGGDMLSTLANTELGVNYSDWIVRSRQSFSRTRGLSQFSQLDAYVQTSLPAYKAIFQAGQINAAGAMFDTPPLLGMQFFPEGALLRVRNDPVIVSGIAQGEARVEVRQNGALIHTTMVPPGPFALGGLTLNNANIDLEVTVTETDGATRRFIVPASSFSRAYVPSEKGLSVAIGKPWRYGGGDDGGNSGNWLATARLETPLGDWAGASFGAMVSPAYHALGAQLNRLLSPAISAGMDASLAHAVRTSETGLRTTLNVAAQFSQTFSGYGSYSIQSERFRSFSQATAQAPPAGLADRIPGNAGQARISILQRTGHAQVALGASYRHPMIGGVGAGYSQYRADSGQAWRRLTLNWGNTVGAASLSASVDRAFGRTSDTLLYFSLSMPFGSGSLSSSASRSGQQRNASVNYSDRLNDYVGYSVSSSVDDSRQVSSGASVAVLARYAQANMSFSRAAAGSSFYTGRVAGGILAHAQGVTLSPYAIRDTFALVTVSGMPGIKIQTPDGPVWTDYRGMAVAAAMPAYAESRLQLVTSTLPRNADVSNGIRTTGLGRGAVGRVDFDVARVRRVLLRIVNPTGQAVAKGVSVFDQQGKWLTSTGTDGVVFLNGDQLRQTLRISNAAGDYCLIDANLPAQAGDALYERADAICQPGN